MEDIDYEIYHLEREIKIYDHELDIILFDLSSEYLNIGCSDETKRKMFDDLKENFEKQYSTTKDNLEIIYSSELYILSKWNNQKAIEEYFRILPDKIKLEEKLNSKKRELEKLNLIKNNMD